MMENRAAIIKFQIETLRTAREAIVREKEATRRRLLVTVIPGRDTAIIVAAAAFDNAIQTIDTLIAGATDNLLKEI